MADTMQKDLVLSTNEFAYVLDETKGHVSCLVGPTKMSLSQSDTLVRFDEKNKRFIPCSYEQAKQLVKVVPENWYCILKNPIKDNKHPNPGVSNNLPDSVLVGKKINIRGPVAFALYPGQMAKVIRGHALRSNQYLLARVYEADEANANQGEIIDAEGNKVSATATNYVNGQILVIKGTEVSFYIPPTGIEVIPIENNVQLGYVREAVTLERLEYCILKDENGEKRYKHGPDVVFPEPTETFVTSPKGGYVFRAIELSPISGVYVKVIAEYTEGEKKFPIGTELFITGNDQMIYYPRPEHAIITYDGKIVHHAIAIPEGEGRYILNRLTGEIKTVKGPQMYLPDPRFEVVVKRKLTPRQCNLWYPGNAEVLKYNNNLSEKSVEKATKDINTELTAYMTVQSMADSLAYLETNANISRGTSYTKPRTITLDTKYDGVVTLDVWTGYAVNIISKDGTREIVCGPRTVMLDYDQTLEEVQLSTGKPKTTDNLIHTVFLRHENNKVSDIIDVETKDFVKCSIRVSYCVDFLADYKDKWFNIDNYVKYLTDRQRSLMKREAKKYTIEEFYQNYVDIIRDIAIDKINSDKESIEKIGRFFKENGMLVYDCEVLDSEIESQIFDHQRNMVEQALQLTDAEKTVEVTEKLSEAERKQNELNNLRLIHKMELQREEAVRKLEIQNEINRKKEAETVAEKQAEKDMQTLLDEIKTAELARKQKDADLQLAIKRAEAEIEKAKKQAYADTVVKIMSAVSPDLVAALTSKANTEMVAALEHAVAPYAIATEDQGVADVVARLTKGLPIEEAISQLVQK